MSDKIWRMAWWLYPDDVSARIDYVLWRLKLAQEAQGEQTDDE